MNPELSIIQSCPMCGEMLNGKMYTLSVDDKEKGRMVWDCDSVQCAARLFRRMYPSPKEISSFITCAPVCIRKHMNSFELEVE